ncbi:hypothetical protein BGZ99_000385 [Dissophora globulifera]|uniref:C3H1-type domain-containing protein n=1 Tax=Dissophora globulifera TaxID=979702 RepID=A0A9P6RRG5_9FUNG|nr:hypothetical protein BGZ99_000385 [Dissophora globulifera]
MSRIQLGTPQEKELTAIVLAKLNEYGWADNDVLANFIVVMVANDKSKPDIVSELNDILPGQAPEFVDWLFASINGAAGAEESPAPAHVEQAQSVAADIPEEQDQSMVEASSTSTRSRPTGSGPQTSGRLLQSAISGATRADSGAGSQQLRQAPSRVYEDERRQQQQQQPRERRTSRGKSTSPVRSREGITTRGKEERIRFRRTSQERAQDEARIDARLGNGGRGGEGGGDKDRLRGRLGRIEDRLGWKTNDQTQPRDRSWDRSNDYHDRQGDRRKNRNRSNSNSRKRNALRDIERRLGTRPQDDDGGMESVPRQPASWSKNPEQMFRVEAEITRQAVAAETGNATRCRFWPNCSQGDQCQYWHPRELCTEFPNCPKTADTCLFIHPLAEPTAEQVAAATRQALMQSMRSNVRNGSGTGGAEGDAPILNAMQLPFALGNGVQDCKFGARCTRPDCKFRHPQKETSQQPCRFFPNCTKPNCPFFHPPYGEPLAQKDTTMDESGSGVAGNGECKFNPCTRVGCPFRHVPGSTSHNKSLILNGSGGGTTRALTSERFASGVVEEGQVEKLHVPASMHWANGGVSHQQPLDAASIQAAEAQAAAEMDIDMDV